MDTIPKTVPSVYYQYMTQIWNQHQTPLADSLQDLKLQNNDSIVINESKSGKFGRTLDAMPATLLNNNQPLNGNISMEIHSADEDKIKTPKSYVRFYGVAAMYKKG